MTVFLVRVLAIVSILSIAVTSPDFHAAIINSLLLGIGLVFIILAIVAAILPRGWVGRAFTIAAGIWIGRRL